MTLTQEQIAARYLLINALRSGEYPQGHGQLRSPEGFCCQGVACDIFAKHNDRGYWSTNHFILGHKSNYYGWNDEVMEYFGVNRELHEKLMAMNDRVSRKVIVK